MTIMTLCKLEYYYRYCCCYYYDYSNVTINSVDYHDVNRCELN